MRRPNKIRAAAVTKSIRNVRQLSGLTSHPQLPSAPRRCTPEAPRSSVSTVPTADGPDSTEHAPAGCTGTKRLPRQCLRPPSPRGPFFDSGRPPGRVILLAARGPPGVTPQPPGGIRPGCGRQVMLLAPTSFKPPKVAAPRQRSPDKQASNERRRRLARASPVPAEHVDKFTQAELAATTVISGEIARAGACDIAWIAGKPLSKAKPRRLIRCRGFKLIAQRRGGAGSAARLPRK